jgi:serine-type D-Ala-D-Ala carboxypeptidase (penicillin-binding protein 5/6)
VLLSHAAARRLPIASTTKLMTAYVVLRELPLDRMVRAAPYEAEYGESLLGLRAGQRISVRDLLYGLILRSGNDAAYDLAWAAAGSERAFVRQMNRYAAALGLADTHYANPIGLDQRGNHSSARDLATLTRRLLAIPEFARIAAARSAVLRSVRPRRRIETINELLQMAPWVTGVKTGHTFGARYVLVGSGRRKGVELIAVAIGAPTDEDRFQDDLELLRYGFGRYQRRVPVRHGQSLADPSIRYAGGDLPLRAARTVAVGLRRGQRLNVAVRAPAEVEGPLERGARLGAASVYVGARRVAVVALRAGRAVPKASRLEVVGSFLAANVAWLVLASSAILIGGAFVLRCRKR